MNHYENLFVIFAFLFQIVLIVHFALRKWKFDLAVRRGWIVYALCLPAVVLSLYFVVNNQPWDIWTAGVLFLAWAIFGYFVEYRLKIEWRSPPRWEILAPYLLLYLSTVMFYWWPLANIHRPLWNIYLILFLIASGLNITSHKKQTKKSLPG